VSTPFVCRGFCHFRRKADDPKGCDSKEATAPGAEIKALIEEHAHRAIL
jgi:hypothetical protein